MPMLHGGVSLFRRQTSDEQRRRQFQNLRFTFVDGVHPSSAVDGHGDVLSVDDNLQFVEVAVVQLIRAEHGRHGNVADVVADPDASSEELGGDVVHVAVVQQDSVLAPRRKLDGEVDDVLHAGGGDLQIGSLLLHGHADGNLASFADVPGQASAGRRQRDVVLITLGVVLAVVRLTRAVLERDDDGRMLAELAVVTRRAFAHVLVVLVLYAGSVIVASQCATVHVALGAVAATETRRAFTSGEKKKRNDNCGF